MEIGLFKLIEFSNITILIRSFKDKNKQVLIVVTSFGRNIGRQATIFLTHCNKSDFNTLKKKIECQNSNLRSQNTLSSKKKYVKKHGNAIICKFL